MKRLIPLLFLLVLLTSFVVAEEIVTPSDQDNSISEKFQEIKIGESLKSIYGAVFNLESSDNLDITELILLTLLLIFFLLIFHSIISSMSSFNGAISWITALVLTFIFAILGGIRYVALLVSGLGKFNLDGIGWFGLILLAIGLFILFFILNKIFKKIKQSARLSKATEEGRVVGTEIAKLKAISDVEKASEDYDSSNEPFSGAWGER